MFQSIPAAAIVSPALLSREKKLKLDLFKYLPSEIVIYILSTLPPQTILICKCVCKWLHDLVQTHEFAHLHLSKSLVPGLAITIVPDLVRTKTIELTNAQNQNLIPGLHLSTITTLNLSHYTSIEGSADGLLLLMITLKCENSDLYLCNPFTREKINLHSRIGKFDRLNRVMSYGFGVSKITGRYKAVWIHDHDCMVYTIGTRSWRSIGPDGFRCSGDRAVYLNGNLHWFGHDINDRNTPLSSCFDLETELFTTFSPPPDLPNPSYRIGMVLAAAEDEDSLCLCDCTTKDVIIVWLMKEYGADKSWTKEFVITDIRFSLIYPIRVSKDWVILKSVRSFLYYSSKNKSTQEICETQWLLYVSSISHIFELSFAQTFRNGGVSDKDFVSCVNKWCEVGASLVGVCWITIRTRPAFIPKICEVDDNTLQPESVRS